MEYNRQYQCVFCVQYNDYYGNLDRNSLFLQPFSNDPYHNQPLVFYDIMTNTSNYMNYCNVLNQPHTDQNTRYVQLIDRDNLHSAQDINGPNQIYDYPYFANSGVLLCTCNEFINHTLQNREIVSEKCVPKSPTVSPTSPQLQPLVMPSDNSRRLSIISQEKNADDTQENSIYSNNSLLSEPMCRFCHLSKNSPSDPLISPCLCSGTLKLVHQNCLKTWLDVSKKQRENALDKNPHCELCNFKYIRKRKFQFGNLRYPKLSQNDCALHLIFLCSLLVMLTSASVTILCFAMEKSGSNMAAGHLPSVYDKISNGARLSESNDYNNNNNNNKNNNKNNRASKVRLSSSLLNLAQITKKQRLLCEYLKNSSFKETKEQFLYQKKIENSHKKQRKFAALQLSVICATILNSHNKQRNGLAGDDGRRQPQPNFGADTVDMKAVDRTIRIVSSTSSSSPLSVTTASQSPRLVLPNQRWQYKHYNPKQILSPNGRHRRRPTSDAGSDRPTQYVNSGGISTGRLWILSPEEAVTLASGVIFFIAFFIAMVVQVKSSYTCYQLVMQWVRLNYTFEVQPLRPSSPMPSTTVSASGHQQQHHHYHHSQQSHRNTTTNNNNRNRSNRMFNFCPHFHMRRPTKCCLTPQTVDEPGSSLTTAAQLTTLPSSQQQRLVSNQNNDQMMSQPHRQLFYSRNVNNNLQSSSTSREYIERCITEI